MFRKKIKCPSCKEEIEERWNYCPYCGEELREELGFFGKGLIEDVEKEIERMDKEFSKFLEIPKIRFKPSVGGISITIHSATGKSPKVEVKTFGEYKNLEPEIKKRFGVKEPIREVEEKKPVKVPRITEEPEAEIKNLGNRQIISVKLPDVKEKDIEIRKLEQSIEIKAIAGDKAYFKLIPISSDAEIVGKEFKNGVLKIDIER
ncbi:MAG: zinc ribbon domain-containing protein [Candidatus Aenigmatarchaeota archaeon]